MPKNNIPHDSAYKALFSNPAMVKSLLVDFIPDAFIGEFNFDTLEHCSGTYITDDLRERRNDIIWRLRWKDTWCYIYIMAEFQSSQNHWMALRILAYTALLWEDLVRTGVVKTGDRLPPVFPIVLYNGDSPWSAARELSELVLSLHPVLDGYQPRHKYCVLDEKRVPPEVVQNARGGAAYVLRVEQASGKDDIFKIAVDFDSRAWGEDFTHTRLEMLEWMDRKIRQIAPGWQAGQQIQSDKEESMLAELIAKHKKQYIDEGLALGEARGRAQGETNGMRRILKDMLGDRFGEIPSTWDSAITSLNEPASLARLTRSVYQVGSPAEFWELLSQQARLQ